MFDRWWRKKGKEEREKAGAERGVDGKKDPGPDAVLYRTEKGRGEQVAKAAQSHTARVWSAREQGAAMTADPAVLSALRDVNRAYEEIFGRIYIVCAVGKSAEELLALAKVRLTNDATTELACAAVEQKKITELRLVKMVLQ